jgi:glycosyltransferase involved in cell wall biosynthesis
VARGLGGDLLPARFPLNEPVLENSLAVVTLTRTVRERAQRALGGRPTLHLPHHVSLPPGAALPRDEARRILGLPADVPIITAPGLGTAAKRLEVAVRVVSRLRRRLGNLLFVVAGALDERLALRDSPAAREMGASLVVTGRLALVDFVRHVCAADAILALRFPSHGEISGALVRTLGVGRPALVTAGTPASEEFPEGVVVPIDPGPYEEAEMAAALQRLLADRSLAERVGACARAYVASVHALPATVERLVLFLEEVAAGKATLLARLEAAHTEADGLFRYLVDEALPVARELGLAGLPPGVESLLRELAGARR